MTDRPTQLAVASLLGLVALMAVMLAALYFQVPPHPPSALAPLIAAGLALGLASAYLLHHGNPAGIAGGLLFAVLGYVSYGPQKLFVPEAMVILPAVLLGSILTTALVLCLLLLLRRRLSPAA